MSLETPAGISGFAWRFFPRSGETPTARITNGGRGGKAWFQVTARSNARGNVFWMSFNRRRFVGLLGMVGFGSAWLCADGPIIARRAAQQDETSGSEAALEPGKTWGSLHGVQPAARDERERARQSSMETAG